MHRLFSFIRPALLLPAAASGLLTLLGGCAALDRAFFEEYDPEFEAGKRIEARLEEQPAPGPEDGAPYKPSLEGPDREERTRLFHGSGRFVDGQALAEPTAPRVPGEGDIIIKFEGAEISEVVAFVLGEILQENYLIDPAVKGTITVQTNRPVDSATLLSILESALSANGAALIREPNLYRIVPKTGAVAANTRLADARAAPRGGYQTMVIPLRYIAAKEMKKILEPVVPAESLLVDEARNLITLSGTSSEVADVMDLVETFDVNWLKGMSVGLVRASYTDIGSIVEEVRAIIGDESEGPLAGMVRIVPIERLNSALIISAQPRYLDEIRRWIERLDLPSDGEGRQLFVYRVENGRAEDLAEVLNDLFAPKKTRARVEVSPTVAPGLEPYQLRSRSMGEARIRGRPLTPAAPTEKRELTASIAETSVPTPAGEGVSAEVSSEISFIADRNNNALLILATPSDYARIKEAIRQLDLMPLQVLVEVAIFDVLLSGDLAYGVQSFFESTINGGTGAATIGAPLSFAPTFQYSFISGSEDFQLLFRLLAEEDKVRVISTPSLMVLDNQSATIRVGDQIPIATDTFSSTGDLVSTSVSFKDTGVTLTVTPRVNSGGFVSLDISQDVTNVGEIDEATGQRTFFQRSINSVVAVQSGDTLVLGGLIQQRAAQAKSGVPGLYKLPVVGNLFGQTVNETNRNELVVFITPRAVRNREEARLITREYKYKIDQIDPLPFDEDPNDKEAEPAGPAPEAVGEPTAGRG
jgi:general secretion pathway protein D